ncbi:unnamed protein product, partial [Ectocarpus sp. 12 AP-2014]
GLSRTRLHLAAHFAETHHHPYHDLLLLPSWTNWGGFPYPLMLPRRFQQEYSPEHYPFPPWCFLEKGGGGVMSVSFPATRVVGCLEGEEIHLSALAWASLRWDPTGHSEDERVLSQVRRLFPPVAVYHGSVDHDCHLEVGET